MKKTFWLTLLATVSITILLVMGLFSSLSWAGEATLFGEKQYVRTTGKPNQYTDAFSARYTLPSEGKIILLNGEADGSYRITSARIYINGEQIFRPDDFKQHAYPMEATFELMENNELFIELGSKPGDYLSIRITREVGPPLVSLRADPEAIRMGETSTLSWTSTDADACTIAPGIGAVETNGTREVWPTGKCGRDSHGPVSHHIGNHVSL